MTNETWALCWQDPVCVSLVVASAVSIVSLGRRIGACDRHMRSLDWSDHTDRRERRKAKRLAACQYIISGSIVCGGAAFGLALIGAEQWPKQIKSVAGLVVVGSVAVDFSGPLFAKFLRMLAMTYIRLASEEGDRATRAKFPDEVGDGSRKSD